MMSATHTALSVAATSLALGTASPALLVTAALAAQLPDVDTSNSRVGRLFLPISQLIEKHFPHRTVTHSFLATGAIAVLTLPIAFWWLGCWQSLILGYFMGWFGDSFTKQGVAAFYPSAARLIIPGNPRLRLSTGSNAELFVLTALIGVAIASIHINSSGGILRTFNQSLGIPSGAVEIVSNEGSQYLLTATINGREAITQQPVDAEYEVIRSLTQNDLLIKDRQGKLYRAGTSQECQIITNRVVIQRGQKIRTKAKEIQLQEQVIAEAIAAIPLKRTYINGTLTLEDAEDLVLPTYPDRFDTITIQPGRGIMIVRLDSANPAEVKKLLGDYYATGSLIIRTVEVL